MQHGGQGELVPAGQRPAPWECSLCPELWREPWHLLTQVLPRPVQRAGVQHALTCAPVTCRWLCRGARPPFAQGRAQRCCNCCRTEARDKALRKAFPLPPCSSLREQGSPHAAAQEGVSAPAHTWEIRGSGSGEPEMGKPLPASSRPGPTERDCALRWGSPPWLLGLGAWLSLPQEGLCVEGWQPETPPHTV